MYIVVDTSPLAQHYMEADSIRQCRDRKSRLKVSDGSIYCDQAWFKKFKDEFFNINLLRYFAVFQVQCDLTYFKCSCCIHFFG